MNYSETTTCIDNKILAVLKEYYTDYLEDSYVSNLCEVFTDSVFLPTHVKYCDNDVQVNYTFYEENKKVRLSIITGSFVHTPLRLAIDLFNRNKNYMVFDCHATPLSFEDGQPPCYQLFVEGNYIDQDPDEIISCLERCLDEVNAVIDLYKSSVLSRVKGKYDADEYKAIDDNSMLRIYRLLEESKIDEWSFWDTCSTNRPVVTETPIVGDRMVVSVCTGNYSLPIGTYSVDDQEERELYVQRARDMCFAIEEVLIDSQLS